MIETHNLPKCETCDKLCVIDGIRREVPICYYTVMVTDFQELDWILEMDGSCRFWRERQTDDASQ
jgi:hypothetical protein